MQLQIQIGKDACCSRRLFPLRSYSCSFLLGNFFLLSVLEIYTSLFPYFQTCILLLLPCLLFTFRVVLHISPLACSVDLHGKSKQRGATEEPHPGPLSLSLFALSSYSTYTVHALHGFTRPLYCVSRACLLYCLYCLYCLVLTSSPPTLSYIPLFLSLLFFSTTRLFFFTLFFLPRVSTCPISLLYLVYFNLLYHSLAITWNRRIDAFWHPSTPTPTWPPPQQ